MNTLDRIFIYSIGLAGLLGLGHALKSLYEGQNEFWSGALVITNATVLGAAYGIYKKYHKSK